VTVLADRRRGGGRGLKRAGSFLSIFLGRPTANVSN